MKDGLANGWNCPHVQYLLNDLNLLDNIEVVSILLFKGFPLFGFLIFLVQKYLYTFMFK